MNHERRFLSAMRDAGIVRVVVIDDALEPPTFRDQDGGGLVQLLDDAALAGRLDDRHIGQELRQAALAALLKSEFDADEIGRVWNLLYQSSVDRYVAKLDPGGRFKAVKWDNANALRPFMKLLAKCDPPIDVTRVGKMDADVDFKALKPQLVFLDYILDEKVSAAAKAPSEAEKAIGVNASRKLLSTIVEQLPADGPAVVLMSSCDLPKDETDKYRRSIRGCLFSSRFQFVQKGKLKINGDNVEIQADAAGALLDLAQCRSFGVELNEALDRWRSGVEKAIKAVFADISDLELRDFAYLIRFRLAEEGQPLSEYLEWFFGEVLLDRIGHSVDWSDPSFDALNRPIDGPGRHIEGMFDGATGKIAEMFSRVRVDKRPVNSPRDRRMGDLYMADEAPDEVRAVITPDCDLIHRGTGPRAKRLLTVTGKLQPIAAPNVTAADFIMHDGKPHSVEWNTKDLQTAPFGLDRAHPPGMTHAGTMRPLYALELQRRVLDDVGRVGLAIAPALNHTAISSAFLNLTGALQKLDTDGDGNATCSVMPPRGDRVKSDERIKSTIVFHRGFVERFIDAIVVAAADYGGTEPRVKAWIKKVKGTAWQDAMTKRLLVDGIKDGETFEGVVVSIRSKPAKPKDEPAFCQIIVEPMAESGEDATAANPEQAPAHVPALAGQS